MEREASPSVVAADTPAVAVTKEERPGSLGTKKEVKIAKPETEGVLRVGTDSASAKLNIDHLRAGTAAVELHLRG